MSYTTTKPSVPHIWAFRRGDPDWKLASASGWTRADLAWERLMEGGNAAFCAGDMALAGRLFAIADVLARLRFGPGDPRRATAPAARAALRIAQGRQADVLTARARQAWQGIDAVIADMQIRPRIRSSLFHLRMEAKHRGQYQENLRLRLARIAAETGETLAHLGEGATSHRHYARWRGEKPPVFDDTRKVLGAALLIPDTAAK